MYHCCCPHSSNDENLIATVLGILLGDMPLGPCRGAGGEASIQVNNTFNSQERERALTFIEHLLFKCQALG